MTSFWENAAKSGNDKKTISFSSRPLLGAKVSRDSCPHEPVNNRGDVYDIRCAKCDAQLCGEHLPSLNTLCGKKRRHSGLHGSYTASSFALVIGILQ